MENKKLLSVVIPAFNEELMIEKTTSVIDGLLTSENIPHRLVFVDDGSKDLTWEKIKACATVNENVTGVHFSRNFGKESAVYAGLTKSIDAACSVVIDCDLQHPPEKIVEMYRLWEQGYEVVEGVKSDRGEESKLHELCAAAFYGLMSAATKIDMKSASDFKLLDRKAVISLVNMKEKDAFFRALSSWVGYKSTQIKFEVREREVGESKWSVKSLIKYAINNITSFSSVPMQIVTAFGGLAIIIAIIRWIISLFQKSPVTHGFSSVISAQMLSSGIIMVALGIIGYYISKIYDEVKDRPKFIISETCGDIEE